jgi:NAD(P)-dependent dehydrogenase (short-subunit alcohol dehydrogenase family)
MTSSPGQPSVQVIEMELDSFASIRAGAADFLRKYSTLNVLICNAGVMACPESQTKDGFEMQFGVNHLGHFLLFQLLKDTLVASTSTEFPSRVVSLSSSGHRISAPLLGDYNFQTTPYNPWQAYGQSKTANIYLASQIEERYGKLGLHGVSLHPGCIHTSLERHIAQDEFAQAFINDVKAKDLYKSPEQGAATTVWAAVCSGWPAGRYLEDVNEAHAFDPEDEFEQHANGYAAHAYDKDAASRLWEYSTAVVAEK